MQILGYTQKQLLHMRHAIKHCRCYQYAGRSYSRRAWHLALRNLGSASWFEKAALKWEGAAKVLQATRGGTAFALSNICSRSVRGAS